MTVFFTSDLHIGHEKVAETRTLSVEDHDALIVDMLSEASKRDQVWILGDLSAGGKAAEEHALNILAEVKGSTRAEYHLVIGNHDSCHPQHMKAYLRQSRFLEVFDSVQPFAYRKIGGRRVLLSHYPYDTDHTDELRFTQWRLRDEGRWLLHGHTHQTWPLSDSGREICVGVDAWGFNLVSQDRIASCIEIFGSEDV